MFEAYDGLRMFCIQCRKKTFESPPRGAGIWKRAVTICELCVGGMTALRGGALVPARQREKNVGAKTEGRS